MTPSATVAGGRVKRWTREAIIEKIREWNALYGEPPRAADWNPSQAKWGGAEWRIERYRAGDWPSLNAAKAPFEGSFVKAIEAAGFEPTKPGPRSRKTAAPALDDDRLVMEPRARALLEAAEARVRELEGTVATRDRQLERARAERPAPAPRPRPEGDRQPKIKTETRTIKVPDPKTERALKQAQRRIETLEGDAQTAKTALDAAGAAVREANAAATKAASKLERAEATVAELRSERRSLKGQVDRLEDRAGALAAEVERLRAREPEVRVVTSATDNELATAIAARDRAEAEARAAEGRAAVAEREHREVAALVTGERRRLGRDEIAALRRRGPAGEKVLAGALGKLAAARKAGAGKEPMREALVLVATAAVTWMERL